MPTFTPSPISNKKRRGYEMPFVAASLRYFLTVPSIARTIPSLTSLAGRMPFRSVQTQDSEMCSFGLPTPPAPAPISGGWGGSAERGR